MWGTDKDTRCVFANANKVHLLVRSKREREREGGKEGEDTLLCRGPQQSAEQLNDHWMP